MPASRSFSSSYLYRRSFTTAGMLRHVEANSFLFQVSVDYRQPFRRRDIDAANASSVHDNLPNIRRYRPFDILLEGAHISEEQVPLNR